MANIDAILRSRTPSAPPKNIDVTLNSRRVAERRAQQEALLKALSQGQAAVSGGAAGPSQVAFLEKQQELKRKQGIAEIDALVNRLRTQSGVQVAGLAPRREEIEAQRLQSRADTQKEGIFSRSRIGNELQGRGLRGGVNLGAAGRQLDAEARRLGQIDLLSKQAKDALTRQINTLRAEFEAQIAEALARKKALQ